MDPLRGTVASPATSGGGRDCSSERVHGCSPRSGIPKDMHPKQSSDTLRPVLPRFLYFIAPLILSFLEAVRHPKASLTPWSRTSVGQLPTESLIRSPSPAHI